MLRLFTALLILINLVNPEPVNIRNLFGDPLLLLKQHDCRIQVGTLKIIHPLNITMIEEAANALSAAVYNRMTENKSLGDIAKLRIKKLYTNLHGLKPVAHHRTRRWDTLGSAWKWVAGSPDAHDLRLINSTMNNLINENNAQISVNNHVNERLELLTNSINQLAAKINQEKSITEDLDILTTILHINTINQILEDIQEAVTLSKISLASQKILSTREIVIIKTMLEDQGVTVEFPDEALQFVTPKIAVSNQMLLYILHAPYLDNTTSTLAKVYPLVIDNRIISNYPSKIIIHENTVFTSEKPEDFVQKQANLKQIDDNCIKTIIFGKQSECNSTFTDETSQILVSENTVLIVNAKNQTLTTNCGSDDQTLLGNFLVEFSNCTIFFNNQQFKSEEITTETIVIQRAYSNVIVNWTPQEHHDLKLISNETLQNRRKLENVYLQQYKLSFKLWSLLGSYSFTTIITMVLIIIFCIRMLRL